MPHSPVKKSPIRCRIRRHFSLKPTETPVCSPPIPAHTAIPSRWRRQVVGHRCHRFSQMRRQQVGDGREKRSSLPSGSVVIWTANHSSLRVVREFLHATLILGDLNRSVPQRGCPPSPRVATQVRTLGNGSLGKPNPERVVHPPATGVEPLQGSISVWPTHPG